MQDTSSDLELARRAAGGDESSWRRIYEATADLLFSLLAYQVGDRSEAQDLLQETYIQAFRRLSDYRGDAPLAVWLRRIALRRAIDWKRGALRKIKRTVEIKESSAAVEMDQRDLRFETERTSFKEALGRLSKHQRVVLLLREWEQWDFREIAQVVGCKESTARVHHVRARERMRELLGKVDAFRAEGLEGQKA